jgi:hypothetical protein
MRKSMPPHYCGAPDPYVGGSRQHCVLCASFVLFQKLGANGRSHDQHRRICVLHGHGQSVDGRSPQGRRFELSSLASLCCRPTIIPARLSDQCRWLRTNDVRFAKFPENWLEFRVNRLENGVSLRIRRDGKRSVQTIKWLKQSDLFDRGESETEISGKTAKTFWK